MHTFHKRLTVGVYSFWFSIDPDPEITPPPNTADGDFFFKKASSERHNKKDFMSFQCLMRRKLFLQCILFGFSSKF